MCPVCMVRSPAIPEIARLIVRAHNRVTSTTRNNSRARSANFVAKDDVWHSANGRYVQGRLTSGAQSDPKMQMIAALVPILTNTNKIARYSASI